LRVEAGQQPFDVFFATTFEAVTTFASILARR
jgi:hypothetical protein